MATLPIQPDGPDSSAVAGSEASSHLKQVPSEPQDRERIARRTNELAQSIDKSRALSRKEIDAHSRAILKDLNLPEAYLGWTMVATGTAFWREQVSAIPYDRRLLLLPHCLRDVEVCPAEFDEYGLQCEDCGACELTTLRGMAQKLGYKVLIAEGSPIVLKLILSGRTDAVLGVGCLNSLEKALDKVLMAGLPSLAVPLFACTCRNTSTDIDAVVDMINTPYQAGQVETRTQVHLLRGAATLFKPESLARLLPTTRGGPSLAEANGQGLAGLDPIAATEQIAHDFLTRGGKFFRPFITLATYDAMTGSLGTTADGAEVIEQLPDAVKRVAMAIELFHKASLVHDDIEDDDAYRYGRPTVHQEYGTATAINVGDFLIGRGYQLMASQRSELPAEVVADILGKFADAHTRLCEGQGAELAWRESTDKRILPIDALKIYALKTSPAFEAALVAGLRLAGPLDAYETAASKFSRHLGVAFQILNDLEDWVQNESNKCTSGGDVIGGRPTLLLALALESLPPDESEELHSLVTSTDTSQANVDAVSQLYEQADVFEKASQLVNKHADRARAVADEQPEALRELLHYFVDTIIKTSS